MKDLISYQKHNSEYNSNLNDFEYNKKVSEKYKKINKFKTSGFKKALDITTNKPDKHIDIGSGAGWLVNETSKYFNIVIGIEPSNKAVEISKKMVNKKNVFFINKDMIDGIKELNPKEPVFITTSVVLSHIQDYYIKDFLKLLDTLPNGSVLYFDERYDKNIQWPLWYIRNKNWWASNLKEWQLTFFGLKNSGYKSGIYGVKVGKQKVENKYKQTFISKIFWKIQEKYYKTKRKVIDIIKSIKK